MHNNMNVKEVEKAIGTPVQEWKENCYAISCAIVKAGLVNGFAVYGHYVGPVAKKRLPFERHGWVLLKDGRVLDPTRWVFENVPPYIYIGLNNGDYDEGGNAWASENERPCPLEASERNVTLTLEPAAQAYVEKLMNRPLDGIGMPQVFWLANLAYDRLGPFVEEIYRALEKAGHKAFVSIDNWRKMERENQGGTL